VWARELGLVEKQKRRRRNAPRNRYVAGAKLSEHKFLRLLHGFAQGTPIKALEPTTHVSGKTIRSTYGSLRGGLACAAIVRPEQFGQSGRVFSHESAPRLFRAVLKSRRFKRLTHYYAPRLDCPVQEDQFVKEKIVRLLCALDLRDLPLHDDAAVAALIETLCEAIPRLHPREPRQRLADFIPDARPHAHPEMRLFEDYRRYLLKSPLRAG
jgi:hypothetical protein